MSKNESKKDSSHGANNEPVKFLAPDRLRTKVNRETVGELLAEMNGSFHRFEQQSREMKLRAIAQCVSVAQILQSEPQAWEAFCEHALWEGVKGRPKTDEAFDAVRFVLRWTFGTKKTGTQKASLYWRAIQGFVEKNVAPSEFPEKIKAAGGLNRLVQPLKEKDRQAKALAEQQEIESDEDEDEDGTDEDDTDDSVENDPRASTIPAKAATARLGHAKSGTASRGASDIPDVVDESDPEWFRVEIDLGKGELVERFKRLRVGKKVDMRVEIVEMSSTESKILLKGIQT